MNGDLEADAGDAAERRSATAVALAPEFLALVRELAERFRDTDSPTGEKAASLVSRMEEGGW